MTFGSNVRNPYPGPRPFEREEQNLFFGREREVKELLSLVVAHQVVVLYAQSGAGKTSVLNAGLIPMLTEEGFEVLPVARVRGFEPEGMDLSDIANIYVFNTLVGWSEDRAEPASLIHKSIASFLKGREHLADEFEEPLPRLAIFDQFEELFTFYPERWKEREGFFSQIVGALEADPLLRVLFVMREDYLASLDSYDRLFPGRLRTRYRMERLRQEAACLAVEKPLRGTGRSFAEGVASSLVQALLRVHAESAPGETVEVTGEYVEPVQLQVVCQSLWESLPADVTAITVEHLETFGDVVEALKGFYERTLEAAQSVTGVEERSLREWFDKELITPAGTRGTVFRGEERTGKIPNSAVDVLEDQHIIRAEMRAGGRWYELTHDRLIEPIRKSNEVWFQRQHTEEQIEEERKRVRAEEQAKIINRLRRLIAALFIVFLMASFFGVYSYYQKLVVEQAKRATERQRQLVQEQARIAEERQKEAEEAKREEEAQRQRAEEQARIAEGRRKEAVQAEKEADTQRQLAQEQARIAEERRKEAEEAKREEEAQRQRAEELARIAEERRLDAEGEKEKAFAAEKEAKAQRELAQQQARIAEERRKEAEEAKREEEAQRQRAEELARIAEKAKMEAEGQAKIAEEQRWIVLARNLATQADLARNLPADLRVLLAVESVKMLPASFENVQVLRERLVEFADATAARMTHQSYVYSAVFSPDGRYLATVSNDRTAWVWEISTRKKVAFISHKSDLNSVDFSSDGRYLATACEDGSARIWEVSSSKEVACMNHESSVNSVCFSPDGRYLATACEDGSARVWEAFSSKEVTRMNHRYDVISAVFSPDGRYLATAANDKIARIWEVSAGRRLRDIDHESKVNCVCFSPDGRYLATAEDNGTAHIWEVSTGKEVLYLVHGDVLYSVAFSPDSMYLATASKDRSARIWEVFSGQQVARMDHQDEVYSVCFSPDDSYLATASRDTTALVWLLLPEDLIARARSYVNRNFTQEEWRKYLADEKYRKIWSDLSVPGE